MNMNFSLLKQGLRAVLLVSALASVNAMAEEKDSRHVTPINIEQYEPQLEHQRDPNQTCTKCHKFDGDDAVVQDVSGGQFHAGKFHGLHMSKTSPNTGKPITCVNCHGNISEDHKRGVKDVMRFNATGKAKNPQLERSAQEQNQVCFACHNPDKLREKFWPHDMHANKMACVNCHELHPEKEPMKATDNKQRVKLCVDCHSSIHERKANAEKAEAK
ncbi:cytochrome c nitrite reductase pentaheme subunit [Pasteurellaceae bacterium RH1A]|nr:cytochrome c nitrite reductase pentaheme subunit [Pasteurellaceae bacterium RH1A]